MGPREISEARRTRVLGGRRSAGGGQVFKGRSASVVEAVGVTAQLGPRLIEAPAPAACARQGQGLF